MMMTFTNRALTTFYALSILLLVMLFYSVLVSAPIIQQVEAEIGHNLTCNEAYQHREIDASLYNNYRMQGDIVYFSNLFAPVWLGILLVTLLVAISIKRLRRQITRLNWWLLGLALALLVPILICGPVIQKIACATE